VENDLEEIIYHGLGFIIIILLLIIAYKFLSNYRITKQKEIIAGLLMFLFFLAGLFFHNSIFLLNVIFNYYPTISDELYYFFNFGFIPVVFLSWFYCFMNIIYPESNKLKYTFYVLIILSIIYEIFFVVYLFFGAELGVLINDPNHPFIIMYRFPAQFISLLLAIILVVKSILSRDLVLQLRGIFLAVVFIFMGIGLILDTGIFVNTIQQLIGRILIIIGAYFIYYGFFLTEDHKLFQFICRVFSISME